MHQITSLKTQIETEHKRTREDEVDRLTAGLLYTKNPGHLRVLLETRRIVHSRLPFRSGEYKDSRIMNNIVVKNQFRAAINSKTISRSIVELYAFANKTDVPRFTLVADFWTCSSQAAMHLGVRVYFVDHNWMLASVLLETQLFDLDYRELEVMGTLFKELCQLKSKKQSVRLLNYHAHRFLGLARVVEHVIEEWGTLEEWFDTRARSPYYAREPPEPFPLAGKFDVLVQLMSLLQSITNTMNQSEHPVQVLALLSLYCLWMDTANKNEPLRDWRSLPTAEKFFAVAALAPIVPKTRAILADALDSRFFERYTDLGERMKASFVFAMHLILHPQSTSRGNGGENGDILQRSHRIKPDEEFHKWCAHNVLRREADELQPAASKTSEELRESKMALIVTPADRTHLAPFQYEKHLGHQDGLAGTLSIRLVEARNLRAASSMFFVRTCNPYVIFRVGKMNVRSSTILANDNPSWRREMLEMKIPKIDLKRAPLENHSDVRMELIVDVMNEDSLTGKTTEYVGMANGSVIGTAVVDFTPLIEGKEGVMDRWITLTGGIPASSAANHHNTAGGKKQKQRATEKEIALGEVRIVLHYEPHGMEPQIGDVVKMEGFGAYPSALLAPIDELEMHVKKISGNYLLCSYVTKSGFEAAIRLHRNNVFVAHRNSLLDRLYVTCIAEPFEFVSNTPIGQSAGEILRPYVNVAKTFSFPALKAAKATIFTTFRASSAALGAVVASMD